MADEADQLYELPLSEFTGARTDLEKRLRKDGKREEAAEVKALRKPTAPAWALNQVARRQPKAVKELIQAGQRVRDAQEKLLAGGDRKPLDRAAGAQREATKELVRAAVKAADEGGVGTGAAFEEKVGQTLRAAAADDEVAEQFAAGRLVREQEAVGLFGLDVPAAAPARDRPAPKKKRKSADKGDEATSRAEGAERRRAETLERKRLTALEAARKAEQRARRAAEAADRATAKERTTAERAIKRLEKAESDEQSARAKLDEALAEVERLDQEGAEP
ncbi:MAG TPA: hypothetical protein VHJ37_02680 [Thermoleophilaceae bacterium]|jgi:hypothetical protein|nr:hypothetical protein [Thermoleophilaceae bacterium]